LSLVVSRGLVEDGGDCVIMLEGMKERLKKKYLVKVVVVVNKYRWLDFFIVLDFFSILFFSHFALICFLYFFGAFLYYFSPLLDFV
jgi:hypothetical protein